MQKNIYPMWQEKRAVKIKNKGLSSLATSSMSNSTKLLCVNNKYVWPNSFEVQTKGLSSTKKIWAP